MTAFTESIVEQATLARLENTGYTILSGPDIASGELLEQIAHGTLVMMDRTWIPHSQMSPNWVDVFRSGGDNSP